MQTDSVSAMRGIDRKAEQHEDLDLTPLLDVVFIVLIFFIVTASFARETGIGFHVPGNDNKGKSNESPVVLLIKQDGSLQFNGSPVGRTALSHRIAASKAINPSLDFVVDVHPMTKTRYVVAALDEVRKTGDKLPPVSIKDK